ITEEVSLEVGSSAQRDFTAPDLLQDFCGPGLFYRDVRFLTRRRRLVQEKKRPRARIGTEARPEVRFDLSVEQLPICFLERFSLTKIAVQRTDCLEHCAFVDDSRDRGVDLLRQCGGLIGGPRAGLAGSQILTLETRLGLPLLNHVRQFMREKP